MRPWTFLAALRILAAVSAAPSFSVARPGQVHDLVVTEFNTLNGTYHHAHAQTINAHGRFSQMADATLSLRFINYLDQSRTLTAYVTGLDSDNRIVFVKADGTLVYPSSGGSQAPVPINEDVGIPVRGDGSFVMELPIALSSGRIYFAQGRLSFFMVKTPGGDGLVQPSVTNLQDPNAAVEWGFVELSYSNGRVVYANISYVDFVGLILSLDLTVKDGSGSQTVRGLAAGSVSNLCFGLQEQSNIDGYPWSRLCVTDAAGAPIRVLSPSNYGVVHVGDFQNYWSGYVDDVWSRYCSSGLTINTQSAAGNVECRVSDDVLRCGGGDNRGYAKPTASDIWGCNSGPFEIRIEDKEVHRAIVPRLCAAFVRSTLLLEGGDVQPSLDSWYYYTANVTSHYSRLVHRFEVDGKGYAFPYDDVTSDRGQDASGLVSSGDPDSLNIYIGGPVP